MAKKIKRNKIKMSYDVIIDRISITDRINDIVDRLKENDSVPFLDCFAKDGQTSRQELVVTFLAVLELARRDARRHGRDRRSFRRGRAHRQQPRSATHSRRGRSGDRA